jgi:Na+/H+-dicarboxylate symporter
VTAVVKTKRTPRLSLSAQILIGLGLGVVVGLFFGQPTAALQPVADIYIRLMQMTVLPYLVMALVIGFGQLERQTARRLAVRGGALLLLVWVLTCAVLAVMPWTFPDFESASFFSHALVEPPRPFSIPDLYFTANPFHSLANAVVPAIVLFSSMIGIGLIGLDDRDRLLATLRVLNEAIVRITRFVVGLTPIGVFAIGAVTAGTMTLETLERLEVYLVTFAAAAVLLTFWVLPLLVVAMTPFSYREVIRVGREAMLTAFVANNAFIVLPMLVDRSKALLRDHGLLDTDSDSAADILIPILFNFPNAGRLMTLLFIPFAAWIAGDALGLGQYPTLFVVGVSSYFAKAQVALPFLLDLLGLPHDLFQLYIPTTIIGGKFDSMVTAMNLLVFALLGAGAMAGFLVLRTARLVRAAALIVTGIAVSAILVKAVLAVSVDTSYHRDEALRQMHAPRGTATAIVHRDASSASSGIEPADASTLERIRARGTLRVGYDSDNLPFSFFNADGELVGLDVELACGLADSLDVRAEFVPTAWPEVAAALERGDIDVMPSVWYRPFWFSSLRLSDPYLTATVGLIVPDERRHEFATIEQLRNSRLRIGVPLDTRQIEFAMRHYFGETEVEFVVSRDGVKPYLEGTVSDLDGFLLAAESGAAWTLLHPEYTVVVPQPDPVELPTAFGVSRDAGELLDVVDEWVVFAVSEGITKRAYDYWILGRGAESPKPRWSILRNVLGRGDTGDDS